MRSNFRAGPLQVSAMGPMLIPVTAANYGVVDKYEGIYIEYTDEYGVFLIGDAYNDVRREMSVVAMIEHFRTHAYSAQLVRVGDTGRGTGRQSTPTAVRRQYVTHTVDRGTVRFVAAVPHSAITGFGFQRSASASAQSIGAQANPAAVGVDSYGIFKVVPNILRIFQPVVLNTTRAEFLDAMIERIENVNESEVRERAIVAKSKVVALLGYPNSKMIVPMCVQLSNIVGRAAIGVERFSMEQDAVIYSPWLSAAEPISAKPSGIIPVKGHSFYLPQLPCVAHNANSCGMVGGYYDEDLKVLRANAGQGYVQARNKMLTDLTGALPASDETVVPSSPVNTYVPGQLLQPSMNFGCGHMTNILGPLATKQFYGTLGVFNASALPGTATWTSVWTSLVESMDAGRLVPDGCPDTVDGRPITTEEKEAWAIANTASVNLGTYRDLSSCVTVDPRVLATAFGLALGDGSGSFDTLSPASLVSVHPSLARVLGYY